MNNALAHDRPPDSQQKVWFTPLLLFHLARDFSSPVAQTQLSAYVICSGYSNDVVNFGQEKWHHRLRSNRPDVACNVPTLSASGLNHENGIGEQYGKAHEMARSQVVYGLNVGPGGLGSAH